MRAPAWKRESPSTSVEHQQRNPKPTLIGDSPAFLAALQRLVRIAATPATVLIEGETGTGKELAARVVHYESARCSEPFIPVNCGAVPDALLESELFGHRAGAFTDAKEARPGILRLADGGTLFLDEVDSLSLRAQVVMLRFLQERTVRPLGSGSEHEVDVRIVCACNRRLEQLVAERLFREDLFYRLNVVRVELPPLRARGGDVVLFAEHFLQSLAVRYGLPSRELDAASKRWLCEQSWPGNVRQLENFIESEFLMAGDAPLLRLSVLRGSLEGSCGSREATECWDYRQARARALEEFDRQFLGRLMQLTGGNVSRAAQLAHKERRGLGRLLQKYAISPSTFRLR